MVAVLASRLLPRDMLSGLAGFTTGRLHVRRAKGGETAIHPRSLLRRPLRETERGTYFSCPSEALH
jgi:hypothetical protein